MKKRFCLIGIIVGLIVAGVALASCSNLIEDLKGKSSEAGNGFGMWPQTIKAADVTVDESESKVVGIFTYYKGSDGAWYVKQQENAFSTGYKYSDGTDVAQSSANSYKYFKVEPIKWVVLTDNYSGKKLLHSEKILIGRRYDDDSNNYKNSEIRSWLNGDFYNTAFTSSEQNRIADTNVDNSARSTNTDSNPNQWNSGANPYVCENTTDRIFLLSEQEVTKSEYGFAEYNVYKGDSNGTTESTRIRMTTDFAKASGAYQNTTAGYGGWWWLRSPSYLYSINARDVGYGGGANGHYGGVYSAFCGVCPALSLKN
jgi:hypothetical protein